MSDEEPWPAEIRLLADRRALVVTLEDGSRHEVAAELLRVSTPSAERKGHSPAEEKVIGGKRNVRLVGIEPVGNYALRLVFDDGHSTGLYPFTLLADLARRAGEHWAAYERALQRTGLSRERPGEAMMPRH